MKSLDSAPWSLRSYDRLEDRIRQHRQVSDAPVVIVEGPNDAMVLRTHLEGFDVFPADGKNNALSCCRALMEWDFPRFVSIVDRDFDWREHEDLEARCFPYMLRDLELMLVSLGVLAAVLDYQGSAAKIQKAGGSSRLVDRLVELVEPVARLRAANAREGWGIAFDSVDLGSKIDQKSLTFKLESYCTSLASASDQRVSRSTLLSAALQPVGDDFGPRGKDVLVAAGVALRRVAGALQQQAVTESVMVGQLHSSCGLELRESDWLQEVLQRANTG